MAVTPPDQVLVGPAAGWAVQPSEPYYDGTRATNYRPTGTVTISGTAIEGQTLSIVNSLADSDGLGSFSYQWYHSPSTAIVGATSSTYTLQASDVGEQIIVTVSYTDGASKAESVTSPIKGPVQASGGSGQSVPDVYLPGQPSWAQSQLLWIHWSVPKYVYTGIDMDYKMTGYDWQNRTLAWSLTANPAGMTINSTTGVISWTPGGDGDESVTVRLTAGGTDYVEKTFTLTATQSTTYIKFVSTTGNDTTGDGSISTPYATLAHASAQHGTGSGTILMRGGTYSEVFTSSGPIIGGSRSYTTPLLIASYPTESAIIDSSNTVGWGLNVTGYVIVDKLECKNFTMGANENWGAFIVNGSGALKRSVARNSHWEDDANVSGICQHTGSLVDSCECYDNYDLTPFNLNSSNYIYYADRGTDGDAFCIDSYGGGYTLRNFFVKHAGSGGPIHYHRCVAEGGVTPFYVSTDYSSVSYCVGICSKGTTPEGTRNDAAGGLSAVPYSANGMLWRNNLFVIPNNRANGFAALRLPLGQNGFWVATATETGMYIVGNKLVATETGVPNRGDPLHVNDVTSYDLSIYDNVFYDIADVSLLYESNTSTSYTLAEINALSQSSGNTYSAVPATIDFDTGGGLTLGTQTWRWTEADNSLAIV